MILGPHFSEYLYFTITEDCTVMLACKVTFKSLTFSPSLSLGFPFSLNKTNIMFVCQVANVKKETSFHWYKEDDEIVPETPPNVMSGACALPIPMVTTALSTPKSSLLAFTGFHTNIHSNVLIIKGQSNNLTVS